MDTNEAIGRIKILKTPYSEAPLEVRAAFEGCLFPCFPHIGILCKDVDGRVMEEVRARGKRGVIVPQDEVLEIIAQHDPKAAMWLHGHGCGGAGNVFFFTEDEIGIVSGMLDSMHFFSLSANAWREWR